MAMRRFELEDLINRPGTYFNPQIEVVIVVDDSPDIDNEIFDMEEFEGAEWVLVSDESPIDEHVRDELLERFQTRHAPKAAGVMEDEEDLDDELERDELEPDPDPDEEYGSGTDDDEDY